MHEVALMQGMVSTILDRMKEAGASRVTNVQLVLGASGHLSAEAAQQHFEILTADTPIQGASLSISWLPATFQCFSCLNRFPNSDSSDISVLCPRCGGVALEVEHEDVCYVSAIDVTVVCWVCLVVWWEFGMANQVETADQRLRLTIQGIVQGVGFRPFIYSLAMRYKLVGFVQNDSQGVTIEIEGAPEKLASFRQALACELPPLARINSIVTEQIAILNERDFRIEQSHATATRQALISPDTSICRDCLRELFDPTDRRYHYPFINCTNCGPRFTIIQDIPYDREKTTMRGFPMCPTCRYEYSDPLNRRFHAQPNACPVCGPQVQLDYGRVQDREVSDPIEMAALELSMGAILAIKGLGGYHLACNALNEESVAELRKRKRREARPFALMVPDIETAMRLCVVEPEEASLLQSHQRPIVLLKRLEHSPVAQAVAPAHTTLGIMLPYTPLHYLLLDACARVFAAEQPIVLVMTSGNISDEPIAYHDKDAKERLGEMIDVMLLHNRPIHLRCDDSVVRLAAGDRQFLRRSRGYVPEPIAFSPGFPLPLLACGAHLKNTFCLAKEKLAFVSHHIGDLENLETLLSFREGIEHFKQLFDIKPEAIAYDLHPDYMATQYALATDIPEKIGVQHHHAHIASVMAEHELTRSVIGIAADGSGYGIDGAIWGCEIMVADLVDFKRAAHLQYVPLPGGEQAVRQPWRMGAAYLNLAYGDDFKKLDIPFVQRLERPIWHTLSQMMAKGINSPLTSSLGRLFDAVASLLGLPEGIDMRQKVSYEGQAAVVCLGLVLACTHAVKNYPFALKTGDPMQLDVIPMLTALVRDLEQGVSVASIARRFHFTVALMLAETCLEVRIQTGLNDVVLSGGVFQNRLLLEQLIELLKSMSFTVYINRRVPPNDGGLSLGQAAIAAARLH